MSYLEGYYCNVYIYLSSPTFYVTFWSLSMYDIHVPTGAYEKQVAQLNAQIISSEDNIVSTRG